MYDYPDGIKCPTPPYDGQIHITWASNGSPKFVHRWSNSLSKWLDITNVHATEHVHITITINAKCECGCDKVGSSQHSSWCPKYTPCS